ncbi:hypothetical protein Ctob_002992, partial [Chrysochromulina tobinii]
MADAVEPMPAASHSPEAPPLAAANTNAFKPPRKRLINFGELTRGGRTRISMGRRRPPPNRLTPMSIDEDATLLTGFARQYSEESNAPAQLMVHSSPPAFDTQKGRLGSRSRGERSRGLESSQRLTFDMYRGISSPAKLHAPEQAKRQRAPNAAQ